MAREGVRQERYWLELQHHGIPRTRPKVNDGIFQIWPSELGIRLVVDQRRALPRAASDADAHDTLLCIGTGKDKDDPNRLRFFGEESYFKSPEEMGAALPRPARRAEANTLADRRHVRGPVRAAVPPARTSLSPEPFDEDMAFLRHLVEEGARRRFGDPLSEGVRDRMEYELDVIERTGYAGYFLIVWDFIRAARERGIPVGPGRGSAAGSYRGVRARR